MQLLDVLFKLRAKGPQMRSHLSENILWIALKQNFFLSTFHKKFN